MNGRQGDLHIDDVYHKAFIAVDEEGTEAAAATSITIIKTNASFSSVEVHFDRPFLFVV